MKLLLIPIILYSYILLAVEETDLEIRPPVLLVRRTNPFRGWSNPLHHSTPGDKYISHSSNPFPITPHTTLLDSNK